MKTTIIAILVMAVFGAFFPLFGQEAPSDTDQRNTPITVNLIIDGSQALSGAANVLGTHISNNLVDRVLQTGDRLTIWSAGQSAKILYSETIGTDKDKENIKKILQSLPAQGDSADFAGALRAAQNSSGNSQRNIQLTMIASVSRTALSNALAGSSAFRFSRVEEYNGWRMLIIAPDISERVSQAASTYISGM